MAVTSSTPRHGDPLSGAAAGRRQNRLARPERGHRPRCSRPSHRWLRLRPSRVRPRRDPDGAAVRSRHAANQRRGVPAGRATSPREGSRYVGASVSENGTLVYAATAAPGGGAADVVRPHRPRPRHGGRASAVRQPRAVARRAPRGGRVSTGTLANVDIWIIDVARNVRVAADVRSWCRRVAGVVARRRAHRVPKRAIGEVVDPSGAGQRRRRR